MNNDDFKPIGAFKAKVAATLSKLVVDDAEPAPSGSCLCYPASRGYPKYMARGCTGHSQCWVLAEMRNPQLYRDRYFAELKAARERDSQVPQPEEVRYRLMKLGVPANALAIATRPDATQALDGAKLWWRLDHKLSPAVVFTSRESGTGKTCAAAWLCIEWARRYPWNGLPTGTSDEPLVWLDGPRLKSLSAFNEQSADLLGSAASCRLLVVDDAGREGNRPAIEALSDVLMERIDRNRLTVLTSNLRGEEFRQRYGVALADRFRTRAHVVDVKGLKSMRTAAPRETR